MNMFSSFLENFQNILSKTCIGLKQLSTHFSSIDSYLGFTDGYATQLTYGFVASLVLISATYLIFHQRSAETTHSRKQSPRSPLSFALYVITWCLLFGVVLSQIQEETLKLLTPKILYHAAATIGVVCAMIMALWTLGSSAHHVSALFTVIIPSSLLILLPIPLWTTSFELAIVVMLAISLLFYFLIPFLIAYWSSLYSRYAYSLSRAFSILAKGSLGILPVIVSLSALGTFQCLAIDALIDSLGLDKIQMNGTVIPLGYPLKFALIAFSLDFIRLFISIFISSKVYMDLTKEKNSLSSSLFRAISSMNVIARASGILAILGFLKGTCHMIYESEMEKQPKDRNIINIAIASIVNSVLSFITAAVKEVNSLVMNYIGIYGGSYDSETSRKATTRISHNFNYYIYISSGIRHCIAPLLLIFWCGILFLFRDFLLPIECSAAFILMSILTLLYAVDCVHSAIISVFYYDIDTASKQHQEGLADYEMNWIF